MTGKNLPALLTAQGINDLPPGVRASTKLKMPLVTVDEERKLSVLKPQPPRPGITALVALAASFALGLTACSGGGSADSSSNGALDAEQSTRITVGVIPIVDTAPFRLGVEKGFFREVGLDIKVQDAQGGAAIVPAVMSGSNQIGFSNLSSVLIAKSQDLPVKIIGAGVQTTGNNDGDFGGVVAAADSGISSPKDLEGKTVAVNTLNNIGDTLTRYSVEQAGGDPSKVKFVEMAFPDMPAQLDKGNIEAAWVVNPFYKVLQDQGAKVVDPVFVTFDKNLQIGGFFTTDQYIAQNKTVVDAFKAGLKKSNEYAAAHEQEVRDFLGTFTKITPEVAKTLVMPKWPTEIDNPALQKLADEGFKYGMIAKELKAEDTIG